MSFSVIDLSRVIEDNKISVVDGSNSRKDVVVDFGARGKLFQNFHISESGIDLEKCLLSFEYISYLFRSSFDIVNNTLYGQPFSDSHVVD